MTHSGCDKADEVTDDTAAESDDSSISGDLMLKHPILNRGLGLPSLASFSGRDDVCQKPRRGPCSLRREESLDPLAELVLKVAQEAERLDVGVGDQDERAARGSRARGQCLLAIGSESVESDEQRADDVREEVEAEMDLGGKAAQDVHVGPCLCALGSGRGYGVKTGGAW